MKQDMGNIAYNQSTVLIIDFGLAALSFLLKWRSTFSVLPYPCVKVMIFFLSRSNLIPILI